MLGSIKSTTLPLAFWTENPPIHNITAILHLEKTNLIVTGSENGHLIIWNTKSHCDQLLPVSYMISHRSKIMSLCLAGSRKHTDIDYFVSFSEDRELGLWDAGNGRSIEFLSNATYDVQSVCSYESENLKQRVLFCCLNSPEIVIINSMTLSEICTLVCLTSTNIFSTVTLFNISSTDDIILACAVSGLTAMWALNFDEIKNEHLFNPKFVSTELLETDLSDPIKISHNQYQAALVLISSACKFMVYHADNWIVLCYHDCLRGDYFINGEFVSVNCILLHCQSGRSLYYKLPPRSDYEDPLFGHASADLSDNIPHLLYQFPEPKELAGMEHIITTKISECGFIIWKGYVDGSICKWNFRGNTDDDTKPELFSLSNSWKNIKKKTLNIASMLEDPVKCGPVTSLLYLPDLSLFVLGMYSGSIFITNFEGSIGHIFMKGVNRESQFVKLTGHCGPVLSLIHPCSTMKLPARLISCNNPKLKPCIQLLKLTNILWSGSEDFSIRIWNIKTQQCLNIFYCHSAPVILLRLNHLPENSMNICGFSQGLTKAMFNLVGDDDPNSGEIRQMINTSMNAFMVAISEDGGLSIISMMKRRILLYSIEHDSPIKGLGWVFDSGYVLLETVNETVYVWNLSSRSMDRIETDETARLLMENCSVLTKVRSSHTTRNVIISSDMISRHSLSNLTSYNMSPSNKYIRFQFIKTGSSDRFVPVIIFDLTTILNSLDVSSHTSTEFYSLLSEVDNPVLKGFRNSDVVSDFDTLMMDVTGVNRDTDIKISLIKILLSRAHVSHSACQLDGVLSKFLDMKSDKIASSIGKVNTKTGSITFNLKELFKEPEDTTLTIENILLQLSISNKISSPSERNHLDSSVCVAPNCDTPFDLSTSRFHSFSNASINFLDYHSSTRLTKLLLAFRSTIIDKHVPLLLKKTGKRARFSDFPKYLTFYTMEKIFNSLIIGMLDVSDWISTSAHQILVKVIADLSAQEIQNYLLIMRSILLPDLDHYTVEGGLSLSTKIHTQLHQFTEKSFLASDWIWWCSPSMIKLDQDKKNLTKIQIKALVYLALIGTYLQSDDSVKTKEEVKLFSKIFALDNFFLARITCDFLMDLVTVDTRIVKRTANRLISLAMLCLSIGFTVWEFYLNSSTLICQLFEFTEDEDDQQHLGVEDRDRFLLSSLANQSLRCIALARPLVFIMVCYREMLRLHSGQLHSGAGMTSSSLAHSMRTFERQKSSPSLTTSIDTEIAKKPHNATILKKHILFSILEELCNTRMDSVVELLPEIVELYLSYCDRFSHKEVDLQNLLFPVLKFTSVAIHPVSGHVGVGSSNGSLVLFDQKIGKYFTIAAHKKSIKFALFSNDAKHLATYSIDEGMVKIWQISHSGLFHLGSSPYHVKNVVSQPVPSYDQMIQSSELDDAFDNIDYSSKSKKRKSLRKSMYSVDKPSYVISDDSGLGLNWHSDNKTLSINFNGRALRKFKL